MSTAPIQALGNIRDMELHNRELTWDSTGVDAVSFVPQPILAPDAAPHPFAVEEPTVDDVCDMVVMPSPMTRVHRSRQIHDIMHPTERCSFE